MHRLTALLLTLFSCTALAQMPPGFDQQKMMEQFANPAAMQQMADQAQAMQTCMAKIDKQKLDALMAEAKAESQEIDRLCDAGKKDEALDKAMAMGRKMQADPTFKQVQGCTQGMAEMLKNMPIGQLSTFEPGDEPSQDDICSQ